jgi:hypothetical protein
VWGYVKLVPRDGVNVPRGSGAYGDRRLSNAELVDYSRPGFVVVYVDTPSPPSHSKLSLSIQEGPIRPRLEPSRAAFAAGGTVRVENQSQTSRVISCPAAGLLQALPVGEFAEFRLTDPGEYEVFLLDTPGSSSMLFAAPGPFVVVPDSGRFALVDLPPGPGQLHTWHPRFPPTSHAIDLAVGELLRVDLEIGVGRDEGAVDAAN